MNDRITIDPAICHGKPCIRGLRYQGENVLVRKRYVSFLIQDLKAIL